MGQEQGLELGFANLFSRSAACLVDGEIERVERGRRRRNIDPAAKSYVHRIVVEVEKWQALVRGGVRCWTDRRSGDGRRRGMTCSGPVCIAPARQRHPTFGAANAHKNVRRGVGAVYSARHVGLADNEWLGICQPLE
jgi:hypothetical protein